MRRLYPILLFSMCVPSLSLASSPDLFGFGARAMGMAGAVASHTVGFEAVYHNPAGLALERAPGVTLGYIYGQSHLKHAGNPVESPPVTSTLIGFHLPLPFGGILERRLAIGGGFVIPTNTVLTADLPQPGTPDFTIVRNRAQTVTLQAAIALRLTDQWTIGAGFMALSSLEGAIDVAPNAEGRVGSSARDQLVAEYAPIFGSRLYLPKGFAVGSVYRGASAARFSLPLTADLGDGFSIPIPSLQIEGVAQYDPQQVEFEVGWSTPSLRVAMNISWKDWSAFPQPIIYAAAPDDVAELPSPGFSDTWELALGLETHVGDLLKIRGGYRLIPSPVPTRQAVHAHLDSQRHLLAIGWSLTWPRAYVSMASQLHLLEAGNLERPELGRTEHRGHLWNIALEVGVTI